MDKVIELEKRIESIRRKGRKIGETMQELPKDSAEKLALRNETNELRVQLNIARADHMVATYDMMDQIVRDVLKVNVDTTPLSEELAETIREDIDERLPSPGMWVDTVIRDDSRVRVNIFSEQWGRYTALQWVYSKDDKGLWTMFSSRPKVFSAQPEEMRTLFEKISDSVKNLAALREDYNTKCGPLEAYRLRHEDLVDIETLERRRRF